MNPVEDLIRQGRFERARRLGLQRLAASPTLENVMALERAYTVLSDFRAALALLETQRPFFPSAEAYFVERLSTIYQTMATEGHYRLSEEARQGYSVDEYLAKYRGLARSVVEAAGLPPRERAPARPYAPVPPALRPQRCERGRLKGRLVDTEGQPLRGVKIVLGLESAPIVTEERHTMGIGYDPILPEMATLSTETDAEGRFLLEATPYGTHDYLAVCLDPQQYLISTRFLLRRIAVFSETVDLGDLPLTSWQSAPAQPPASPEEHPQWLAAWEVRNPFDYDFPRQPITFPLPEGVQEPLRLEGDEGPVPYQLVDGELFLLAELKAKSSLHLRLLRGAAALPPSPLRVQEEGATWVIETGTAAFRIAGNVGPRQAPLLAMRGADGLWRGEGRFRLPQGVAITGGQTRLIDAGPVQIRISVETTFSNGATYRLDLTALAGEPLLLVRETSPAMEGAAFEFSLRDFSGGRGYLHWLRENGGFHWSTLAPHDEIKAILPEQVPWWIPPQGFGYALTLDSLESEDYFALFSVRRGEWIDRRFESLVHGPINRDGTPNPELDWPYPEMVGSSLSAIHVVTDASGDVVCRFGCFDGERQWGLLASRFSDNDGPHKAISRYSHAYTVPRLRDFCQWHFDEPDRCERPATLLRRADLFALREKTRRHPSLWNVVSRTPCEGPQEGVRFALEGDPVDAWRIRTRLLAVARVRSRATLLGRDWSDMFSPVGGRSITHWVHEYDLVAASGVFSTEEEREVRAFFILMGHLFMEKDFMNWRFNARNANFEADRAEIVGTIGLVFEGHPDAEAMMRHAQERLRSMLAVYCNPESGKWYENPACYYRVASRSWANLAVHLARRGRLRLSEIPLLREFLRWGITLLTPPLPGYEALRAGDAAAFDADEQTRRVPPIGDHAALGQPLMGCYYSIGKAFLKEDPALGQELLDAFYSANPFAARLAAGSWAHRSTGPEPLYPHQKKEEAGILTFFIDLEDDAPPAPLPLESRRLSGFGAVLRRRVRTPEEDYLLIKQGPGGYRYHRTEGSFLLFSEGKPLVYDGGEAGETWRHSTLSFYDVHMPISAGRVERYFAAPEFQFVQGVHPEVIRPGEPVFLSDNCHHELVEECYRRFEKLDPALVRAFAWVGSDYLVLSDHLATDAPSHWHLQVVSDEASPQPDGSYHFRGRHGVDLQLLFPGQSLEQEALAPLPVLEYTGTPEQWFSMMHLQVADPAGRGYLAVLRPLSANQPAPLRAERIEANGTHIGVAIRGEGIDDRLWLHRGDPLALADFCGTYGAVLKRPDRRIVWLGGEGRVQLEEEWIEAGPGIESLYWVESEAGEMLRAEGVGEVILSLAGEERCFKVQGIDCWTEPSFSRAGIR